MFRKLCIEGMYMSRNYSNKNFTNLKLGNIEFYLNEGKNLADIANKLDRDPSGIRKEIKNYSSYFEVTKKCSNCLNKNNCHQKFLCDKIVDQ